MSYITEYFMEEFNRGFNRAEAEDDMISIDTYKHMIGKDEEHMDRLKIWGAGVLDRLCGIGNNNGDFKYAIRQSVDWEVVMSDLMRFYDEEEEEEEEEEETCYSCEETKTDIWYYNCTPVKNAPVCTACRDREETCRCCEIKYPYYQIKHDGGGKYLCITCDDECPCHDSKCGTVCPAVSKIVDAMATKA